MQNEGAKQKDKKQIMVLEDKKQIMVLEDKKQVMVLEDKKQLSKQRVTGLCCLLPTHPCLNGRDGRCKVHFSIHDVYKNVHPYVNSHKKGCRDHN